MKDEKISNFCEYLEESWVERKWKEFKDGGEQRTLKSLGKKMTKLSKTMKQAERNENSERYEAAEMNFKKIRMDATHALRTAQKASKGKNMSVDMYETLKVIESELQSWIQYSNDGLLRLMTNQLI